MNKILAIEDEEQIRSVIVAFLSAAGYEVLAAENGKVGIDLAKQIQPDLILCDINMPVLDGFGVLKALRENPKTSTIPFIFLTGKGQLDDLREGMNSGADDYLIKPFKKDALLKAVEVRLAKQAVLADRFSAELKQLEQKLEHLLHHDSITNLPNRLTLRERFEELVGGPRAGQPVYLLTMSLDRFERLNQVIAYDPRAVFLRSFAQRLINILGSQENVARVAADTFAILLPQMDQTEQAMALSQQLLDRLSAEPFDVEGTGIFATVSIGLSHYPNDGSNWDELIRKSEVAMLQARKRGGDTFFVYDPAIIEVTQDHLSLEADLRYALDRQELELHYQPLVSLRTGEITGAEALLRWHHSQQGMIPPARFIPLAEESGMILAIGRWALKTACQQAAAWQKNGRFLQMAVNVSGRHFSQPDFANTLSQILIETNAKAGLLDLELTESILMKDVPSTVLTLNQLKELGVQVSLDDFGTGYSSLNYLKKFPFSTLKIDQAFVRNVFSDPKNAAITKAMIAIADTLKLKTIAEGVESEEELKFLIEHGCQQMQGYLFSRPVPVDDFERLVVSGKRLALC